MLSLALEGIKLVGGWLAGKSARATERTKAAASSMGERAGWVIALVFVVWSGPMVHAYIDPAEADRLAQVLEALPEWYTSGFRDLSYAAGGLAAALKAFRR